MGKKEFLVFSGRTGTRYTSRHLQINEMTDYTPLSELNGEFFADMEYVTEDGHLVCQLDDPFPVAAKIGMPGPGMGGLILPGEGGLVCNLEGYTVPVKVRELAYTGRWSKGARKRFRKCCDILFQAAVTTWEKHPSKETRFPFQVAFLTLTIPELAGYISPKAAHKDLLKPFLRWMREKHKINGYVWVREFQKNGMIHYHMVYDKFILKGEITRYWNKLMETAGYLDLWYEKYKGKSPASTRVNKADNPEQCAYYMEKYMTKALVDNDRVAEEGLDDGIDRRGKLWDASLNLKAGKAFTIDITPEIDAHLRTQLTLGKIDIKVVDFVTFYFVKKGTLLSIMPKKIQQEALLYYRKILYESIPLAAP